MKKKKLFDAKRTMTKEEAATFWQRPHHQVMKDKKKYDRKKEKRTIKLEAFGPF